MLGTCPTVSSMIILASKFCIIFSAIANMKAYVVTNTLVVELRVFIQQHYAAY
jgi:hypothetical protein